jgi:hypothetical protein
MSFAKSSRQRIPPPGNGNKLHMVGQSKSWPGPTRNEVLSYIAVGIMKMKTTTVADYLNVSQPTVSKSLLIGEEIVNKNPGMVGLILRKA